MIQVELPPEKGLSPLQLCKLILDHFLVGTAVKLFDQPVCLFALMILSSETSCRQLKMTNAHHSHCVGICRSEHLNCLLIVPQCMEFVHVNVECLRQRSSSCRIFPAAGLKVGGFPLLPSCGFLRDFFGFKGGASDMLKPSHLRTKPMQSLLK